MMIIRLIVFPLLFHLSHSENAPPTIVEQPQDLITELDKPMAIHCRAESSSLDDLQIDWYKDGRLVMTDRNARIITEFMALHVINTMPQDAGVYHCVAKNSFGQTQSRKARIQFLKLDKEFIVSPSSMMVSIGERVRLRCTPPQGSPTPAVYWTKDGKNLSLPLDHHDIVLSSVQKSDFGSYRCIASNGLLRQSSPAYLTEFHQPKISVQPSTSRLDVHRGQPIHLECHIDNEQYQLEWHFHDQIFLNQTIDIASIEFNQSGLYTCMGRFEKYTFREQILVAVYERDQEKVFSRVNQTVFLGQSARIDCQLPFRSEKNISWKVLNQSFTIDTNEYRFTIPRISELHQNTFLQCSYEDQASEGLIQLNVRSVQPPPIVSFVPNNQTVPIGVEVIFPCQSNDQMNVQWWFLSSNRPYRTIKIDNNRKYRINANHHLTIRHVDKSDAGAYKCITTNKYHDQTIWTGHLSIEDARSNTVFRRVELKDLPPAPSQPIASTINSHSIELTWNSSSTDVLDYLIEYYQINSNQDNLQWKRVVTNNPQSRQLINNLQPDSIYEFLVRAKNSFGYGPPSMISTLITTKNHSYSNEEFIHLYDPIDIQETSITIKWDILRDKHSIKQYSIYIINEKDQRERIEMITDSRVTYTIDNLRPYTDYSIRLVPFVADVIGRASNTILARTSESVPSSSPTQIVVRLLTTTDLSIQWHAPLENETNGRIVSYKINCLTSNESYSIRLNNISADAKGLFIRNLLDDVEYCISIAARTRIGYGPYSSPICVLMNEESLQLNQHGFKYHLHEAISQPWFLPVIIVVSIFFTCAFSYALWLCFHYFIQRHRMRTKFHSSASSSNQSVELPVQKTLSNGKRYDLIKDTPLPPPNPSSTTAWMNSIPHSIRLQCCANTTSRSTSSASEHCPMNIHKNPINALLHESRQASQPNPYATTGIFQPTTTPSLPSYSETVHSLQRQPSLTSPSTQYQPPWHDHYSSSTLQYRSQSNTPHHCMHCTSHSHPHTPSSIRTTLRSPATYRHVNPMSTNERQKTTIETIPMKINASPLAPHSSNSMMVNSVGGETMTTSWASSTDDQKSTSVPSSTDVNDQHQASSENSLFSDSDQQPDEESSSPSSTPALVQFERGPSFLAPNA